MKAARGVSGSLRRFQRCFKAFQRCFKTSRSVSEASQEVSKRFRMLWRFQRRLKALQGVSEGTSSTSMRLKTYQVRFRYVPSRFSAFLALSAFQGIFGGGSVGFRSFSMRPKACQIRLKASQDVSFCLRGATKRFRRFQRHYEAFRSFRAIQKVLERFKAT